MGMIWIKIFEMVVESVCPASLDIFTLIGSVCNIGEEPYPWI